MGTQIRFINRNRSPVNYPHNHNLRTYDAKKLKERKNDPVAVQKPQFQVF